MAVHTRYAPANNFSRPLPSIGQIVLSFSMGHFMVSNRAVLRTHVSWQRSHHNGLLQGDISHSWRKKQKRRPPSSMSISISRDDVFGYFPGRNVAKAVSTPLCILGVASSHRRCSTFLTKISMLSLFELHACRTPIRELQI